MNWREKEQLKCDLEELSSKFYKSKQWFSYELCRVIAKLIEEIKTEQ